MKLIRVRTQEDYDWLMKELDEEGFVWDTGEKLTRTNEWLVYRERTVIVLGDNYAADREKVLFAEVEHFEEGYPDIEIIEADKLKNGGELTMSNNEEYDVLRWHDDDGFTYAYRVEPNKCEDKWECEYLIERIVENDVLSRHDEESCKIDDLLEMYEGSVREMPFLARKKPVEVEAIEYTGFNLGRCLHFVGGVGLTSDNTPPPFSTLTIETLEGNMTVNRGDYIIKGVEGEFYPIRPDIFHKTYDIL